LTAAGLYVKNNQENSRYQNKKKAGNETEIVGFHGNGEFEETVSPLPFTVLPSFIPRSGVDFPVLFLCLKVGLELWLRPGQGARGQGHFQGPGHDCFSVRQSHLRTGEHHKRTLNKGLAGQSPGGGAATKLLFLDWGAWGHGEGIGPFDVHKTSDALAAATAIAKFSLDAVELDPLPQSHFPQVFSRVTLDVPAFTHETNHRHGMPPKVHFAGCWRRGSRCGP
jgi:hypothetical protein